MEPPQGNRGLVQKGLEGFGDIDRFYDQPTKRSSAVTAAKHDSNQNYYYDQRHHHHHHHQYPHNIYQRNSQRCGRQLFRNHITCRRYGSMERDDGLLSDSGIHGRGDGVPHFDDSFKVVVQEVNEAPFVRISGILRDKDGATLCMFSSFIGCVLSSAAKVVVILQACQMCDSNRYPADSTLIIKSDCKMAVLWANGVGSVGNVSLMDSIMEVREILSRLKSKVFVRFVSRFGNALTDFLAKQGVANGLV
ncbi:hypothetical protein QYF36_014898 [Acer negundo]|nr:hypothetical protein QYF36_014898 [Acer negundo]